MKTVEYAPGREADLYPGDQLALLWHGSGACRRDALAILAGELADRDVGVVVPDWNPGVPDRGRDDLLSSLRFSQGLLESAGENPGDLVLVGWSLGGTAALGATFHSARLGVDIRHTVALAAATVTDPVTGYPLPVRLPGPSHHRPVTLICGTADAVVPPAASQEIARRLADHHWPHDLVELDADHQSIVGVAEGSDADLTPAEDLTAVRRVADLVAAIPG